MNCESPNIVGLTFIEYVSIRRVENFHIYPLSNGSYGGSIILQEGYSWKVLSEHQIDTDKRYWEELFTQNVAQSDISKNRVVDIIPDSAEISTFDLDDMQRDRFLVRFETQYGQKYLLGSLDYPLKFDSTRSSVNANHRVEFTNQQPHKALIWNF